MSKHTEGPWKSDDVFFVSAGLRCIASIGGTTYGQGIDKIRKENKANARLIAAAPDLLEAAEWLLECKAFYDFRLKRFCMPQELENVAETAEQDLQAAIDKARGK